MSSQATDTIVIRGQSRMLSSTPLETFLRTLPSQPDFRLSPRGYAAHWEVRPDDTLWLVGLKSRSENEGPEPGVRLLFPAARGPIAANWVNQLLRSPNGERRYDPFVYGSNYRRETNLAVCDGRVVMLEEIDGRTQRVIASEFTSHLEALFGAEESAFLRAIRTSPDDAAPRLVYADWLDERHDPRAGIVRLAERLRGLAPDAAARERAAHQGLVPGDRGHWLWDHIISLVAEA